MLTQAKTQENVISIPFLPVQVGIEDVTPDGPDRLLLFSKDEITFIKSHLIQDGWYKEIEIKEKIYQLKYPVIVFQGKYFAVYKNKLGEGGVSVIKLAQDQDSAEWVAVKLQSETFMGNEFIQLKKINLLITTGPDNKPVSGIKFSKPKPAKQYSRSTQLAEKHYMLMKLGCTDLLKFYKKNVNMPCVWWLEAAIKIIQAVKAIHDQKLLHCDIKLENFLLNDRRDQIWLTDFGTSLERDNHGGAIGSYRGTHEYVAPEIKRGQMNQYTNKVDIYALGVTLATFLGFGYIDYSTLLHEFRLIDQISKPEIRQYLLAIQKIKLPADDQLREDILFQIKKMLHKDPTERPEITEVVDLINKVINKLSKKERYLNVAIVEINECLQSIQNSTHQEDFINRLKQSHIVCLVDEIKKDKNDSYYMRAKRILEAFDLLVSPQVVYSNSLDRNILVKTVASYVETNLNYAYRYLCLMTREAMIPSAKATRFFEHPLHRGDKMAASLFNAKASHLLRI